MKSALEGPKQFFRRLRLAAAGLFVDDKRNIEQFGRNERLWHVCPEELTKDSVIYSFGIGRDISFELALAEKLGATVHLFDPSPLSIKWLREQLVPSELRIHCYGIGDHDGLHQFYMPRDENSPRFTPVRRYKNSHPSESILCEVRRLGTIMKDLGHQQIDLLKLEIEGGEYAVLRDIKKFLPRVRQLLVEFHHMYQTIPFSLTRNVLSELKDEGFRIYHIGKGAYQISLYNSRFEKERKPEQRLVANAY